MNNIKYVFFSLIFFSLNASAIDKIKIAYYDKFHPFSFYNNENLKGIFVDTMKILFKDSKDISIYSEGFPWERAQELVRKDEFDALVTLSNPEREKYLYHTSNPVFEDKLVLVYLSTNPKEKFIKNIKEKNDVKQFMINDYIGNGLAKFIYSENDKFKIDYSGNLETCFLKLVNDRGDIIITNKTNANIYQSQLKGKNLKYIEPLFLKNDLKYYFFLRKSYLNAEKIINFIDKKLAQDDTKTIQKTIYNNYIYKEKIQIESFNK
ncbi:substrate-binding periplasmic protein [Silvanigrella sp.]|jgi:polar amino acid transport system substrate-binding protein|uniref:substrate-binding periplasmic protein n=1 Tax=Silvanigrella sp. TaxID=2024976 RepID=UPI0037C52C3D